MFKVMLADLNEPSMTQIMQRMMESKFGLRYITDQDFISLRISEAVKDMPVEFCQRFYGMSESELLGKPLRKSNDVATNHIIQIPPDPLR